MATVKIILDKRTSRSDGTHSINFQICHNRKTTTRSSKIYVQESDWDDETKTIKKSNSQHKLLNVKLKKAYADMQSRLLLADDDKVKEFLTPVIQIKKPEVVRKSVFQFAQELIIQLKEVNKTGNAWVYESTINALRSFYPADDLYFEQIDYQFLTQYSSFHVKRGVKHNTVYLYLRTLRIFYNKAIKLKLVEKSLYPFDDYKLKPEKTKKRAVEKDVLKAIRNLDLPVNTPIWHSRNYFLLSFYLIGISVVDLSLLTNANISNGRLTYKRRKTGKMYDVKLHKEALDIITIYRGASNYILPIANSSSANDEHLLRGIKYKTKQLNKYLSQMVKMLKISDKVTTYTARHSWATIAKKAGFSIEIIAEALGHEYGNRTTAVYLDTFDQDVIDEANRKVIDVIL